MKKFMVLYMAKAADFEKMMKESTPEQRRRACRGGSNGWATIKSRSSTAVPRLARPSRVDAGGVTDTKNGIGGYSIVQAESAEAAAKLFGKEHPHLQMPGFWIEVMEIMPVPGM